MLPPPIDVHLTHPLELRPHLLARTHAARDAVDQQRIEGRLSRLQPAVDCESLGPRRLEAEDVESHALYEEPQEPMLELIELMLEVSGFADTDDPGVADDLPKRFELVK